MRALVSRHLFLTRSNVRLVNRLRAILLRYYPAAVDLFSSLDGVVTLEFLRAFPTPEAATGLKWEEFLAFARQHRYTRPGDLRNLCSSARTPPLRFRRGCDREFRYISQQWAWHSLRESVWASTYYEQALERV